MFTLADVEVQLVQLVWTHLLHVTSTELQARSESYKGHQKHSREELHVTLYAVVLSLSLALQGFNPIDSTFD